MREMGRWTADKNEERSSKGKRDNGRHQNRYWGIKETANLMQEG